MTNESRNYYICCLNPLFALRALCSLLQRVFWAMVRRAGPKAWLHILPGAVLQTRGKLLADATPMVDIQPPGPMPAGKLKLTVGWLHFEEKPDWSATFADPEITISLHRWNWLLRGLTDAPAQMSREQGLALMRSWLRDCLQDDTFGKDAYSTAERIVNGSLFLLRTGSGEVPSDIQAAFQYMGRQIASHLEYYRGDLTGNHALNNARGLLCAGAVALWSNAVDLAVAICRERLPILITKDGFLREGSSHYHFLFTRWLLEMRWIAQRIEHAELYTLLTRYAKLLVERCWFFLVKDQVSGQWHIPLVGDVSPDFPPSWLLSLPWSRPALEVFSPALLPRPPQGNSWASLFDLGESIDCGLISTSPSFPDSFWHRIDHGDLTVFLYAREEDGRLCASHRHSDLCGFVFFLKGSPVLIDCGRLDYTGSFLSKYGKGAWAHNSLTVNGLPPAVDAPTWFQKRYRAVAVKTRMFHSGDETGFVVRHNGFDRVAGKGVRHERRFLLREESFLVEDQLAGTGSCKVSLRFHWACGLALSHSSESVWQVDPAGLILQADKRLHAKIMTGQANGAAAGLYFPEYGISQTCQTLELAGSIQLPVTIQNQIYLKD